MMALEIFKPVMQERGTDCLDKDDEFYRYTHAISPIGEGEHTICGIACEEWDYEKSPKRKRVTCPMCLNAIKECKTYTGR
jgi:hypothetical protein